jgi:putative ABC transport system permease protein
METFFQDLRYAARMLIKNPGFSMIAVVALALGIGANTAIFSVVNAVLLRPLPYKNPDRLVTLWQDHRQQGGPEDEWASPDNFFDWRDKNQAFDHVTALIGWVPTLTGTGEPEDLTGAAVSHDTFAMLGIEPIQGRSFRPEEDQVGAEKVVVLSHRLWSRRFSADPGVIGRSLTLGGESFTVIGVMPATFTLPIIADVELWRTFRPALGPVTCGRGCVTVRVMARLKPETTIDGARAEMSALAAGLAEQYPDSNSGVGITIIGLKERVVGETKTALIVLLAAVALVLLIACANVANLLLARASVREKEIAVRAALGAGRLRLIRQLLTESVLLGLIGGVLGLLLAFWMVEFLVRLSPDGTPRVNEIGIDAQVLAFTIAIAVLTGLVFGLVPALQSSKPNLNQTLKEGRGAGEATRRRRLRNVLVVAEIALALMLMVGAGLLMKSFYNLIHVDPGFNATNVVTMRVALPRTRYPERHQPAAFFAQLTERVSGLPGVEAAAGISTLPLGGGGTDSDFIIEGRPEAGPGEQQPVAWYSSVTPAYFNAMGVKLIKGRLFTEQDRADSPRAVIIAETMARRYFPGEEPLGKRIGNRSGPSEILWREIVGVVADVKHFGLETSARPTMYLPHGQSPARLMILTVRASSDPMNLAAAVRREVTSLDSNLAVSNVRTMEQVVGESVAAPRFTLLLLGIFAGLAMILAAVGIYGVISYSVTQRTHEIGLRMALGAGASDVLKMVVGQGALLALIGVAIGLAGAFGVTRLMSTLLFNVSATDPLTFALIATLLVGVALAASFIPARKAAKVDPMAALRCE